VRTLVLLLVACGGSKSGDTSFTTTTVVDTAWVPPGCGDGELGAGEQCDDGGANSNTTPNACRADCTLPACGDQIVDDGEACDDGAQLGGDGCDPLCRTEDGPGEVELNDVPEAADPLPDGGIFGSLSEDDVDCFSIAVPECGAVSAALDDGYGACTPPATVALHAPDSIQVATGSTEADGCARLDPAEASGARWLGAGTYSVCVSGLIGAPVPGYRLTAAIVDSLSLGVPLPDDQDGDGVPAQCDDDDDGDGVLDVDDNCPDLPNGDDAVSPTTEHDGFIRHWLTIGPFEGLSSPEECLPSVEALVGGDDDGTAAPALGDAVGDLVWVTTISDDNRLDFVRPYAFVDAPREAYAAVYVYAEDIRDLTLALGPDDGARAWLNGEEVLTVTGCQGTNVDQFTADVTLMGGWNRLLLKVFDQGGGWGTFARFKDGDTPITDLELSLDPTGPWVPGQSDLDGDGVGDVCDDTPLGG
jgi:cysteine-rich repeat protein